MIIIKAQELCKTYRRGAEEIKAVDRIDLEVSAGEFVSFVGVSGSGKTTLLHMLGCLDNPSSGTLSISGKEVFVSGKAMSERALTRIRRDNFGYIFQKFYLIPTLTVKENILLPYAFHRNTDQLKNASEIADMLGLSKRLNHLPKEISGGEMQRVAIARALINKPRIILADEPTGNLDSQRSHEISQILVDLNKKQGITIILVTHNPTLAASADRIIELKDGRIVS